MKLTKRPELNVRNLAFSALFDSADRNPNSIAIRTQERSYTYFHVRQATQRFAAMFAQSGATRGAVITIALPDGLAFVAAFFGALSTGATVLLISATASRESIAYGICKTGSNLLVAADHIELTEVCCTFLQVNCDRELETWPLSACETWEWLHDTDIAYILMSSGSTGEPKLIPHTHSDLVHCYSYYADAVVKYKADDIVLSVPKLSFGYALGCNLVFPFLSGSSIILMPHTLDDDGLVYALRKFHPTLLFAQPRSVRYLVDSADDSDVSNIRLSTVAGESLSVEIFDAWTRRFPTIPLLDGYGTSEIGSIFISNEPRAQKRGSVGKLLHGFLVQIREAPGLSNPDLGELWVTGPSACREYWRDPVASGANIVDSWIRTGDLFRQDEDGYLYLAGRIDCAIKVGCGQWVYPEEIEKVICQVQGVSECVVTGFRDIDGVVRLRAYVTPHQNVRASKELKQQIQAALASIFNDKTGYDVSRIEFLHDLPKTANGKLDRSGLRSDFLSEFSYEC